MQQRMSVQKSKTSGAWKILRAARAAHLDRSREKVAVERSVPRAASRNDRGRPPSSRVWRRARPSSEAIYLVFSR